MNSPSQEDLLGYLLGALDAREQEQVQQLVDQHPQLEARLLAIKASLAPLEQIDDPVGPPPGLARRCCQFVAVSSRQLARGHSDAATAAQRESAEHDSLEPFASTRELATSIDGENPVAQGRNPVGRRFTAPVVADETALRSGWNWSITDVVCACAAALLVGALLIPALSAARFNSRSIACQNNLRSVYNSLTQYAESHAGQFPQIPAAGPLATAGCVGPMLKSAGFLEDDRVFACAGLAGSDGVVHIPATSEILAAETPEELQHYRHRMLGNYGYSLGYLENGKYACPKNLGRSSYVLLADAPHNATPARISRNHGGWGQNCVMADGSIQFNRTGFIGTDAIYFNDRNVVAPGVGPLDAVIAPGYVEPFPASACLQ